MNLRGINIILLQTIIMINILDFGQYEEPYWFLS